MTRIIKRKRLIAMESILALAGMLAAQACFGGPRYAAPAPNYGPYGVYSSGDYQNREWHNSEWWAKNHPQWTHQHHPNWTVASEHHQ
ncbi:MAG: hypothetical protein ACREP6_15330 [Candidatus Binataceae bacterium]